MANELITLEGLEEFKNQYDSYLNNTFATKFTIDTSTSTTSTNAVQNKVITTAINKVQTNLTTLSNNVYTKTQVDSLLSTLKTATMQVVSSLSTTGEEGVIYLVGTEAPYEMYIYESSSWISLGTTEVDLSPYQTITDNDLNTTSKTIVGAINEGIITASASNSYYTIYKAGTSIADNLATKTIITSLTNTMNSSFITGIGSSIYEEEYEDIDYSSFDATGVSTFIDDTTSCVSLSYVKNGTTYSLGNFCTAKGFEMLNSSLQSLYEATSTLSSTVSTTKTKVNNIATTAQIDALFA